MYKWTIKRKNHQKGVTRSQLKKRRKYKIWKKKRNLKLIEVRAFKRIRKQQRKQQIIYTVPKVFVLRENVDEVLNFIKNLKNHSSNLHGVFIDMTQVENLTTGSIGLLISIINILNNKGISVRGNKPLDVEAKKILERSGFQKYVNTAIEDENKSSLDRIFIRGKDSVDQVTTSQTVLSAMKTVSGAERRNTNLQKMLIEMMANSVNHAFPIGKAPRNKWVLAVSHNSNEKKVTFTFVDNGVGILHTLRLKFWRHALDIISFVDNSNLLYAAFEGEIGSQTGLSYRGHGLPSIFKTFQRNHITDLVVITNNVFIDFKNQTRKTLSVDFEGVFYYWEISNNCEYYGKNI